MAAGSGQTAVTLYPVGNYNFGVKAPIIDKDATFQDALARMQQKCASVRLKMLFCAAKQVSLPFNRATPSNKLRYHCCKHQCMKTYSISLHYKAKASKSLCTDTRERAHGARWRQCCWCMSTTTRTSCCCRSGMPFSSCPAAVCGPAKTVCSTPLLFYGRTYRPALTPHRTLLSSTLPGVVHPSSVV